MKLLNSFSISMIEPMPEWDATSISVKRIPLKKARSLLEGRVESCVGHTDTSKILSNILGINIENNRVSVTLREAEQVIVAQYIGPRLPEGATQLPEGAEFQWFLVWYDFHRLV